MAWRTVFLVIFAYLGSGRNVSDGGTAEEFDIFFDGMQVEKEGFLYFQNGSDSDEFEKIILKNGDSTREFFIKKGEISDSVKERYACRYVYLSATLVRNTSPKTGSYVLLCMTDISFRMPTERFFLTYKSPESGLFSAYLYTLSYQ